MKKIYSLLVLGLAVFSLSNSAQAQCTPDANNTTEGASPDPLPAACASEMYDQTIQLRIKTDSTIDSYDLGNGFVVSNVYVTADKIEILSFNGLPSGVDFDCETNDCIKTLDGNGGYDNTCIALSGTPTNEGSGTATVKFRITVSSPQYPTASETIEKEATIDYTISAAGSCVTTAIEEAVKTSFSIAPNPVTSSSSINVSLASSGVTELQVYDIIGEPMATVNLGNVSAGSHQFSSDVITELGSGIYIIKLVKDGVDTSFIQKVVVQ